MEGGNFKTAFYVAEIWCLRPPLLLSDSCSSLTIMSSFTPLSNQTGGVIIHLMVGGPGPHRLGVGLWTLHPLPWVRGILHKVKYWGLPVKNLNMKTALGIRGGMSWRTCRKSSSLRRNTKTTLFHNFAWKLSVKFFKVKFTSLAWVSENKQKSPLTVPLIVEIF